MSHLQTYVILRSAEDLSPTDYTLLNVYQRCSTQTFMESQTNSTRVRAPDTSVLAEGSQHGNVANMTRIAQTSRGGGQLNSDTHRDIPNNPSGVTSTSSTSQTASTANIHISQHSQSPSQTTHTNPKTSLRKKLRIGTWNVRTLYQTGALTGVLHEMELSKTDILGVSETRWSGSGHFTARSGHSII